MNEDHAKSYALFAIRFLIVSAMLFWLGLGCLLFYVSTNSGDRWAYLGVVGATLAWLFSLVIVILGAQIVEGVKNRDVPPPRP